MSNAEHFFRLLEVLPDGLVVADRDGTIAYANDAAHQLFSYDAGELVGAPIGVLIPERVRERHRSLFGSYLAEPSRRGMGTGIVLTARRKDDSEFRCDIALTPLDPSLGEGVIASIRDVTGILALVEKTEALEKRVQRRTAALQAANAELIKAREAADAASQAKSAFLANMSHEIRTPMTGILGLTHLLSQTRLDRRQQDFLEKIRTSAHALLEIINDILDISKIEAGGIALQEISFALDDVLSRISNIVSLKAHKKDLELVFRVQPDVPERLLGDPLRLGQVLLNLLDNAVKFTEQGEVVLTIALAESEEGHVALRFDVRDTGIGMDPSQVATVFEPFAQADSSISRTYGGTGLGLPIAKRLVGLMGGALEVETRPGEGCVFRFVATFGRASERQEEPRPGSLEIAGRRALVIDDARSTRETLAAYLEDFSMEVRTAPNAEIGLKLISAAQRNNRPFHLVVCDFSTPGLKAHEVTARIREASPIDVPLVIALITSFDMETLAREARHAKVAGVLVKPINQSTLFDAVVHALLGSVESERGLANAPQRLPVATAGGCVLLVEDHPVNQEVARAMLASLGLEVVLAPNGAEAVELCRSPELELDVVLMDLHMPRMNGYDAARAIRRFAHRLTMPILAMTADAMQGTEERCRAAGMDGYITKPIDPTLLVAALAPHIRFAESREAAAEIGPVPQIDGIDVPAVLERIGGQIDLFDELLATFCRQHASLPNELRAALDNDRAEKLKLLAHTLRGSAAHLGMTRLAALAKAVEESALDIANERRPALVEALALEYARASASIAAYLCADA